MAGVLTFDQYLGGADQLQMMSAVPSDQKIKNYNFNTDITGWVFSATYRVIIPDSIACDRYTGDPNFGSSLVLGSFPQAVAPVPVVKDALTGSVDLVIPADMYTGKMMPNARLNVPISILTFTWSDGGTPEEISTHRWGIMQTFESDVEPGDPTQEVDYTELTVGA
ncbi:MAG: hypothetical protein DRR06_18335 [Gammaproteobacteria bacterium]|nr:MAG: hypothetical protein DRR06_18335 [Gammaproteobacteria bacterium]